MEEMSVKELEELLAAKKAGDETPADPTKTVVVEGHTFTVNIKKMQSWPAFQTMRQLYGRGDDLGKVDDILRLIEMTTGVTEQQLVEMAGGDSATFIEVLTFADKVLGEIYPKN